MLTSAAFRRDWWKFARTPRRAVKGHDQINGLRALTQIVRRKRPMEASCRRPGTLTRSRRDRTSAAPRPPHGGDKHSGKPAAGRYHNCTPFFASQVGFSFAGRAAAGRTALAGAARGDRGSRQRPAGAVRAVEREPRRPDLWIASFSIRAPSYDHSRPDPNHLGEGSYANRQARASRCHQSRH